MDANAVILGKSLEHMNTLVHHAIPGIRFFVFEGIVSISSPLLEERSTAILSTEVSAKSTLKAAAESHGRTGLLFAPAVKIAIAIAARAAEILADLCVAIDHRRLSGPPKDRSQGRADFPIRRQARMPRGSDKNVHSRWYERCERPLVG